MDWKLGEWKRAAAPPRKGRRILKDRRGSVGIEFTILAVPFAFLTFSILESCVSFAAQEMLANATDDIAREMRTGNLKPADIDEAKLKKMVCDRIKVLAPSSCLDDVLVDLRESETFAEVAAEYVEVINGDIFIWRLNKELNKMAPKSPAVDPLGKAGSKNTLRVFYKWPVTTDFLAEYMGTLDGNRILHFSSVTWQNEPFSD